MEPAVDITLIISITVAVETFSFILRRVWVIIWTLTTGVVTISFSIVIVITVVTIVLAVPIRVLLAIATAVAIFVRFVRGRRINPIWPSVMVIVVLAIWLAITVIIIISFGLINASNIDLNQAHRSTFLSISYPISKRVTFYLTRWDSV
ncbi:MAG: hypothetical protein L0Z50_27875 [Verrucomicrobiales bacterium]|nr:hypothetical protein [Verrucomicrobiales bacterium]